MSMQEQYFESTNVSSNMPSNLDKNLSAQMYFFDETSKIRSSYITSRRDRYEIIRYIARELGCWVDDDNESKRSNFKKTFWEVWGKKYERLVISNSSEIKSRIDCLRVQDYNMILFNILSRKNFCFKFCGKELNIWRKKVRTWLSSYRSYSRRDTRRIIPNELEAEFKRHLIPIILQMESKDLDILRPQMISILMKLNVSVGGICLSNHWWDSYRQLNPDIAYIWKLSDKNMSPYDRNKIISHFRMQHNKEIEEHNKEVEELLLSNTQNWWLEDDIITSAPIWNDNKSSL